MATATFSSTDKVEVYKFDSSNDGADTAVAFTLEAAGAALVVGCETIHQTIINLLKCNE